MLTQYLQYWICECHRVLHSVKEANEHQHKHALHLLQTLEVLGS